MINPTEFAWIPNPKSQQQLAEAITDGVFAWLKASLS
jgi:N-acetylmuramoyl-L-alanine amidase